MPPAQLFDVFLDQMVQLHRAPIPTTRAGLFRTRRSEHLGHGVLEAIEIEIHTT